MRLLFRLPCRLSWRISAPITLVSTISHVAARAPIANFSIPDVWIANAYFLTSTAFLPLCGQTANIFGRRSLTLLAIVVFAVGSAVAGSAPNLGALIAGRALQGIGGGGINIFTDIILADIVPLRERPKYMGFLFIPYTMAVILGPVVGAVLTEKASWRWIFYINLPISGVAWILLAVVLRVRYNKDTAHNSLKRIDIGSNLFLVASLVAILLALTWGGTQYPWSSWRTIVPLSLGLLGLVAFLWVQSTTLIPEPTMPIRLFANRTSLGGFLMTFLHAMILYSMVYFLPVYFQAVKDTGILLSGVNTIPLFATAMAFATVSALLLSKYGRYLPLFLLGWALISICMGLYTRMDGNTSTAYWASITCVGGIGIGFLVSTTLPAIQAPLTETDQAIITATWGFVRSFGGIWGVAIPAAVFNSRVNDLAASIKNPNVQGALSNGGAYALASSGGTTNFSSLDPTISAEIKSVYVNSLKRVWQVALGFSLLGFVVCFTVKEVTLRTDLDTDFGLEEKTAQAEPAKAGPKPLDDPPSTEHGLASSTSGPTP